MKTLATWNGTDVPLEHLRIPVEDRSFFFGDGVYEVVPVYCGIPFLLDEHLARLSRGLDALRIPAASGLAERILANLAANAVGEGSIYVQISRGSGARAHSPLGTHIPNELIYTKASSPSPLRQAREKGAKATTHPDLRSRLVHVKSVNLLPNCLAKGEAERLGALEAILVDREGRVTEGSSTNVFMVSKGVCWTPPTAGQILPGITRAHVITLLRDDGHDVRERSFSVSELFTADEVFVTGSTTEVAPISEIDGRAIGNGSLGELSSVAQELLDQSIRMHTGMHGGR